MDAISLYRTQIREFFERSRGSRKYKSELLAVPVPKRVIIDINDVRRFNKELCNSLIVHGVQLLPAFEEIAQEISQQAIAIGISGVIGERVSPRELLSRFLGRIVCIEGIVTSTTIVRPKVKKTVHYNRSTNSFAYKEYRDIKTLSILPPTSTAIPRQSLEGNALELEYGLSEYIPSQAAVLQEMPELSPPGQMPRGINLLLENDLADLIKPGDRVRVYGTYKCISHIKSTAELLRTTLILNNVEKLNVSKKQESIENIQDVLRDGVDKLIPHIAPSIYGNAQVKKALLLLMIGGTAIEASTGGRIRGDINVLLVGDPGIAKSQLLRYVLEIAPLSIGTTGRGASGVGLTAAVVSDPDTGGRRIEAGAMVLGDTGIVCIDEFDKMDETERAAIHEAMEQQTVTIAKGGIYTTLNARCSVLAAANPVSGQYRGNLSPKENIRLPESILTRFDLIFILEDTIEYDSEIAEHVLKRRMGKGSSLSVLTQEEIKAYIATARAIVPELSHEAEEYIGQEYLRLREEGEKNRLNLCRGVTARMLETIIRLATAHAKARLSEEISLEDAAAAVDMLECTLWRKSVRVRKEAPAPRDLLDVLYQYRENNPYEKIISVDQVVSLCSGEKEGILDGLKALEKEGILAVADGMVIFS